MSITTRSLPPTAGPRRGSLRRVAALAVTAAAVLAGSALPASATAPVTMAPGLSKAAVHSQDADEYAELQRYYPGGDRERERCNADGYSGMSVGLWKHYYCKEVHDIPFPIGTARTASPYYALWVTS